MGIGAPGGPVPHPPPARRGDRPLDDVSAQERAAFELLLRGATPAPSPPEAPPHSVASPKRERPVRRAPTVRERRPASVGGGLLRVGTGIDPESEQRLHRAAYRLGGEAEKSRIVRVALAELLDELESASAEELLRRATVFRSGVGRGPLMLRRYIVDEGLYTRMRRLAAEARIPIGDQVREAIGRWLERSG